MYRDYVDISVAVASPKGLVVPVLRNVESMNYAEIELGITALGEKARNGSLAVEDMDGGTFTISNGGVFGSLMGTPIINPPQSAILGMHATFERPVAIKGQVSSLIPSQFTTCQKSPKINFLFSLFQGRYSSNDVCRTYVRSSFS